MNCSDVSVQYTGYDEANHTVHKAKNGWIPALKLNARKNQVVHELKL